MTRIAALVAIGRHFQVSAGTLGELQSFLKLLVSNPPPAGAQGKRVEYQQQLAGEEPELHVGRAGDIGRLPTVFLPRAAR